MSKINNSKKGKKITSTEKSTLSDSKINELYSEYTDKEKDSKPSSKLKGKKDDLIEKGSTILKSGEKFSDSTVKVTKKGLKDLENEIKGQKPNFNSLKNKASTELDEFSKQSTTTIKNAQASLKGFGTKFFGKTKKEISESSDYFEKNIPTLKNKLNEEFKEGTESVQKNAPKIGRKIKGSFLDTIEKTHGASTKGKQYGTQSVSILKQIGELKEAGLITEKEYLQKKKELLEKI